MKTKEPFACHAVGRSPTHTQHRSRRLLTQRTDSLAAMELAQKRQRIAATTMQRVCKLPKELQGRILQLAIETPTAAIMKAAIGDAYGLPGWWLDRVGRTTGYQKHLNRSSPCEALWARVLTRRWNGTLAWKWSQTNVFMNLTWAVHERGVWTGIRNERALRRKLVRRKRIPCDDAKYMYWSGDCHRVLFVKMPDGSFKDTGAHLDNVLTEANPSLSSYRITLSWWSAQMEWYREHRWAVENEQARYEVNDARESLEDEEWWRYWPNL